MDRGAVDLTDGRFVKLPGKFMGGAGGEVRTRVETEDGDVVHAWPLDLF